MVRSRPIVGIYPVVINVIEKYKYRQLIASKALFWSFLNFMYQCLHNW